MSKFRTFSRRLFVVSNLVAIILFLLACANTFLHPGRWWFVSLLGLAFPFLLLAVTGLFVFGLFFRSCRRWSIVSFAALLLGWTNIHAFFALHAGRGFKQEKPANSLRILTWNIRSFDDFITRKKGASGHKPHMMEFIGQQNADIVCLQEFVESRNPKEQSNIKYIQSTFNYPYAYFSHDHIRYDRLSEGGVVIFSRYPIVDSAHLTYSKSDDKETNESLISADIKVGNDTFRMTTTHLQSVLFHNKDFHDIEIIKNVDDSILQASKSIAKKLGFASRHRGDQAEEARRFLDKSPYPGVICGDFNDVPNSYTYFTIRGGWQDAYINTAFGIGRTYVHISPTLRIDYILAHPGIKVLQCRKFSLPWSDHSPVLADCQLPHAAQ